MIGTQFLMIGLMLIGLALLRFGVPLLITYLINWGCCYVLHLKTDRASATPQ